MTRGYVNDPRWLEVGWKEITLAVMIYPVWLGWRGVRRLARCFNKTKEVKRG